MADFDMSVNFVGSVQAQRRAAERARQIRIQQAEEQAREIRKARVQHMIDKAGAYALAAVIGGSIWLGLFGGLFGFYKFIWG